MKDNITRGTTRNIREPGVALTANVSIHEFDVAGARAAAKDAGFVWSEMTRRSRRAAVLGFGTHRNEMHVSNATCDGLHNYVAAAMVPSRRGNLPEPAQLAFGDDATSFSPDDTELNNQVGSIGITDPTVSGTSFYISEYVDSLELNGHTLAELGIVDSGGGLWNHAPIPTAIDEKTSAVALIVNVEIPASDVSEHT